MCYSQSVGNKGKHASMQEGGFEIRLATLKWRDIPLSTAPVSGVSGE